MSEMFELAKQLAGGHALNLIWSKIGRVFQCDGVRYRIGREDDEFKGFGGRRFTVAFSIGPVIETSSLWMEYGSPRGNEPKAEVYEGWGRPGDKLKRVQWHRIQGGQYVLD